MQQPVAIICDKPDPSSSLTYRIGMNLSEPMITSVGPDGITYYAPPIGNLPQSPATQMTNAQGKPTPSSLATNYDFYADPDQQSGFPDQPCEAAGLHPTWPIVRENMQRTGTYLNCSSVLLQRLADATLPYNPPPYDINGNLDLTNGYRPGLPINPYITVDWSTLDLHVISGEEDATKSAYNGQDIYYDVNTTTPYYFRSRQRGNLVTGASGLQFSSNPWPPLAVNAASASWKTTLVGTTTQNYFGLNLSSNNSLTNHPALNYVTYPAAFPFDPANYRHSLGSINATVDYPIANGIPAATNTQYYGEPITPFPWFNWNNRPFSNAMELLTVPAAAPSRAFLEMTPDFPSSVASGPGTATANNPYYNFLNAGFPTPTPEHIHWPFGQLMNLFHGYYIDTSSTPNPTPNPPSFPSAALSSKRSPHLYRLLDFVEVPSPFSGAERWYQPASFLGATAGNFQPPFNKLSRFRDPGRVNLNTIFDFVDADLSNPALGSMGQPECIWDALVGQFPGLRRTDGFLAKLLLSRQGDGGSPYVMNANFPTRFAAPFRSADSADLMPNVPSGSFAPAGASMRSAYPASATLLRGSPLTAGGLTGVPQPLFQINSDAPAAVYAQWYDISTNTATNPNYLPGRFNMPGTLGYPANAHDINRNPYFRYQALQKIGNSVATNSNCFAVWITIGYFEVEENFVIPAGSQAGSVVYDAAHPDGFRLGQEIGIDTGDVTRHRGFYIVDRSIPVGFVPGSRLNTDDCILVRRLIE
jgi:hypothetical protein